MNTSGSTNSRSNRSTSASTMGWFSTSAISAVTLQYVSDVMQPDGVGRSRRRRRRPRNDNDKIVEVADAALNKCGIDLANHLVRGADRPGQVRFGSPLQRHLAMHILIGREDEETLARMQSRQSPGRVTGLAERDQSNRPQGVADVLGCLDDRSSGCPGNVLQLRCQRARGLDGGDDARHSRYRLDWVAADTRLARQHDRVGTVEYRVGDI